jgi:molybdopterin synthase sulfur carrier subunit
MVRVLFFASFREQLKTRQIELELQGGGCTVAELILRLIDTGGESWRQVLQNKNLLVAVNQSVSTTQRQLRDGDEVAFYPPVTGG